MSNVVNSIILVNVKLRGVAYSNDTIYGAVEYGVNE